MSGVLLIMAIVLVGVVFGWGWALALTAGLLVLFAILELGEE